MDLTDPLVKVSGFSTLDFSSSDANTVAIGAAGVASMSPTTGLLTISAARGDRIVLSDAENWRMSDPVSREGVFMLTANNSGAGGNETIQADWPHSWQCTVWRCQ